jgi:hypothetical protein
LFQPQRGDTRDFNRRVKFQRDPAGALKLVFEERVKELNVDGALSEAQRRRDELLSKYNTGQLTASQKASLDRVGNLATPTLAPAVSTEEEAVMEEEDTLLSLTEEVEADEDSLRGSAQAAETAKAATSSPPLSPSLPRALSPPKPGLQKAKPELDKLQKDVDKLQQDVVGLVRKVQEEVRRPETKTKFDNIVRKVQEEVSKLEAET